MTTTTLLARYDVAIMSDFRYPGGTSASVAEEIKAQVGAGLSTVLIQADAPHLRAGAGDNPRIGGLIGGSVRLATPDDAVSARLLVVRQPRIFESGLPPGLVRVDADEIVLVINQGPRDLDGRRVYYDIDRVRTVVEGRFGTGVRWVPIGPLVRDQVLAASPGFPLSGALWSNIINVDEWWSERSGPVGDVPVLGRHSRPAPVKWPLAAREILRAYPPSGRLRVRILGGGEIAVARVGFHPRSWELLPFGSMHPREFLQTIDYFVYFHDPAWIEAFGRAVLEAMASGTPAVLPATFRALFADAAVYATPREVSGLIRGLHADWDAYRAISDRARSFVSARFGYTTHRARIAQLGVPVPGSTADSGPVVHRVSSL